MTSQPIVAHPSAPNCDLLELSNGRKIAFAEYGDRTGEPYLFLHGSPGGRVHASYLDRPAREIGVRLIAVDRIGFGYTTADPRATILSFADDMAVLLAALDIKEVRLVGVSGGAPYALATARRLPDVVAEVISLGGMVTLGPESKRDLMFFARCLEFGSRYLPRLTGMLMKPMLKMKPGGKSFKKYLSQQPQLDQDLMLDPEFQNAATGAAADDFLRQGTRPLMRDLVQVYRALPFDVRDIKTPVRLIYGEKDVNVPPSVGEELEKRLPNATLIVAPGAGHLAVCALPQYIFGDHYSSDAALIKQPPAESVT